MTIRKLLGILLQGTGVVGVVSGIFWGMRGMPVGWAAMGASLALIALSYVLLVGGRSRASTDEAPSARSPRVAPDELSRPGGPPARTGTEG
jgi:hypothetical protein